jgi:hypothetical protein
MIIKPSGSLWVEVNMKLTISPWCMALWLPLNLQAAANPSLSDIITDIQIICTAAGGHGS